MDMNLSVNDDTLDEEDIKTSKHQENDEEREQNEEEQQQQHEKRKQDALNIINDIFKNSQVC
jgi:hypothetical protein